MLQFYNRSKRCFVAACEEEPGWKPGHALLICTPCTYSKLKHYVEEQSATPKGSITTKAKAKQTCSATSQNKRKCLDISDKVIVLEFAKQTSNLGLDLLQSPSRPYNWSYFANSGVWINTTVYRDCDNNSVEVKSPVENISFCFWIMFPVTSKLCTDSFQQTGLYPRGEPFEEEPFNGQDLDNLKTIMGRIYIKYSVAEYV